MQWLTEKFPDWNWHQTGGIPWNTSFLDTPISRDIAVYTILYHHYIPSFVLKLLYVYLLTKKKHTSNLSSIQVSCLILWDTGWLIEIPLIGLWHSPMSLFFSLQSPKQCSVKHHVSVISTSICMYWCLPPWSLILMVYHLYPHIVSAGQQNMTKNHMDPPCNHQPIIVIDIHLYSHTRWCPIVS